jgi:hypothetical protein
MNESVFSFKKPSREERKRAIERLLKIAFLKPPGKTKKKSSFRFFFRRKKSRRRRRRPYRPQAIVVVVVVPRPLACRLAVARLRARPSAPAGAEFAPRWARMSPCWATRGALLGAPLASRRTRLAAEPASSSPAEAGDWPSQRPVVLKHPNPIFSTLAKHAIQA